MKYRIGIFQYEETQMGFRKLLEAKDCFVRAHMMRQKLLKKLEE